MKYHNLSRPWLALPALLLAISIFRAAAQPASPITQWRINDMAAVCITARIALSGMKARRMPGETGPQYRRRMEGYLTALEKAARELQPLRRLPRLQDTRSGNRLRWQQVVAHVRALPGEVAAARAAWEDDPVQGEHSLLHRRLWMALMTVMEILNGLRDARP